MKTAPKSWATQVKDHIKRRYSRLAEEEMLPTGGQSRVLEAGYPHEWVDAVPQILVGGYSGCGNPLTEFNLDGVKRIVDLGCGGGLDAFLLAQRSPPETQVIAVDITEAMLRRARSGWGMIDRLSVLTADMEALPLANECADLVTCNAGFALAIDKTRAFRETTRILTPGGRVAIRDLIKEQEIPREVIDDPLADATSLGGVVTKSEMENAMAAAGLTDIEFSDPKPFSYVTSVRVTAHKPG